MSGTSKNTPYKKRDPLGFDDASEVDSTVSSSDPLGLSTPMEKETVRPSRSARTKASKASAGKRQLKSKKKAKSSKKWKDKSPLRRTIQILVCAFIIGAVGVLAFVGFIIAKTPAINAQNIDSLLSMSSTLYDDSGNQIKDIYSGDGEREIVKHDAIPKKLLEAFIAVEDKTFYTHSGFNFTRLVGAVVQGLTTDQRMGGASTITQQLARNIWLTQTQFDRSIVRKIQEGYYAIQLEKQLSKDEIITAYLNTISLGNRSYGVSAASKSYFNKDLKDLTILECAALASLPKAPSDYSMIKVVPAADVAPDDPRRFDVADSEYAYLYNDTVEDRVKLVLRLMYEQKYITKEEYESAKNQNLRDSIHPQKLDSNSQASFFVDYCIDQIADELVNNVKGIENRDEALNVIYNGGLDIHTTLNTKMQESVDNIYNDPGNFPGTVLTRLSGEGNIMNPKPGADSVEIAGDSIMLYKDSNLFDDAGNFYLHDGEYNLNDDGSLTIFAGHRLSFFNQKVLDEKGKNVTEIGIEVKPFYKKTDGRVYVVNGGSINIPRKYKTKDADGNVIIDPSLFKDYPDLIVLGSERPQIPATSMTLRQQIAQPQSACVVLENDTGYVKAMTGGREIKGQKNYNRAINPRQPGSAIKPLGVYGPALQMGANNEPIKAGEASWGKYWTTMSIIDDKPLTFNGKQWPKNWYSGFRGKMSLRKAVEQSVNTIAVETQINVGNKRSVEFLKNVGITTVVTESDDGTTDMNPAALGLGGMTNGTTPLEMASAYGSFANAGEHMKSLSFTKVASKSGKELLNAEPEGTQAMDPGTAYIMNDILHTTVTQGIAGQAQISGTPVAGKTGTTSDNCDFWFIGNTPKYSCSVWIGNDSKLVLTGGSGNAANIWKMIMSQVVQIGKSGGEFRSAPANVVTKSIGGRSDYFLKGTEPDSLITGQTKVSLCADSGLRSTPWCPHREEKEYFTLDGSSETPPEFYCNLHNKDIANFPLPPGVSLDNSYFDKQEQQQQTGLASGGGVTTNPGVGTNSRSSRRN